VKQECDQCVVIYYITAMYRLTVNWNSKTSFLASE
jgi:hypothetical protein